MYTVLIVDDEKIEREGIRRLVEKEDSGCKIVEASDGQEASAILDREAVDILLTDIRMPYKSGLDLAKKAFVNPFHTQTIIFSGLNDFEYARTAIEYGVKDYLLKPVDPDEFCRAYDRARQNIQSCMEAVRSSRDKSRFLSQYFLSRFIIEGRPSIVEDAARHIDLTVWEQSRYVFLLECGGNFFEDYEEDFLSAVGEWRQGKIQYLNLNMNQALLLFSEELDSPLRTAEELLSLLKQEYYREFYIAVSARIDSYEKLPEVYKTLDMLMEEKFYQTGRHIFCENPEDPGRCVIDEGQLMGMLEKDIRNRDIYHLEDHFRRVIRKYSENSRFPSMYVKFVFSNIVKTLWESSARMTGEGLDIIIDRLYGCRTIKEVIAITQKQMEAYMQFISEDKGSLGFKVEATKDYILHHYSEEINLDILAKRLYLSTGYLSMIFKKETGENLNQFIKNTRLEKSAQMLSDTELTVNEISYQTGFRNISYYCRCFRRQYGVTPENYRKNIKS